MSETNLKPATVAVGALIIIAPASRLQQTAEIAARLNFMAPVERVSQTKP
jgi:hypothetical protein